jgi:Protein of unknown function (DUF3822)
MQEFEFQDPDFTYSKDSQLNLSLQIANQFISFAIQEKSGNKLMYLKHIPFELLNNWTQFAEKVSGIINSQDKLTESFSSVEAMWISGKYSLVPGEYSDENYLNKLFQIVHPFDESDDLEIADLKDTGYRLLFSLPKVVIFELKKHWPDLHILHQLIPLQFGFIQNKAIENNFSVYSQVYPDFADIVVYQKGNLKLANSFAIGDKTDLVYHLMNVYKHFGLDPLNDLLTITDHYFHGLSGQDALKKYIRNIHHSKPLIPDGSLSLFQAQDLSRYVNLLNLINCV